MILTYKLKLALLYLLLINAISLWIAARERRTTKNNLSPFTYLPAVLGGALGMQIGGILFRRHNRSKRFRIAMPVLIMLHLVLFFFIYTGIYYHADAASLAIADNLDSAEIADHVVVKETDQATFIDGSGSANVILFYPGAKVQYDAYLPLMEKIAAGGVDCYILHSPYHLAVLGLEQASDIDVSSYEHVYVAGHSMGGAVAGMYAAKHLNELDGVIFLAAYPTKPLNSTDTSEAADFRALSIIGSNDGGYNPEKWIDADRYMPEDFTFSVIEDGNHGNFGNYGHQEGDGEASISREDQQAQTAQLILEFINH